MLEMFAQVITTILTALFILKANTEKKVLRKMKNFFCNLHQIILLFKDDRTMIYGDNVSDLPVKTGSLEQQLSDQESKYYQQKYMLVNDIELQKVEKEVISQKQQQYVQTHQQKEQQKYQGNRNYVQNNLYDLKENCAKMMKILGKSDIFLSNWTNFNLVLMSNQTIRDKYINKEFQQKKEKLLRNCQNLKCACIKSKSKSTMKNIFSKTFQPTQLSVVFEEVGY